MTTALAALLDGLVDYAGLFPPAGLTMPAAVRNYAAYRAGAQRGMLARFVVPVARLEELGREAAALRSAGEPAWPLAVLAGAADAAALDAFERGHRGAFVIDAIEAKAERVPEIMALARALGGRTVYVEVPLREDPEALLVALKANGLRAKIRTGGVTPEAFPTPEQVLRFLATCVRRGLPFKATAGLHHPLRGEYALTYAPDAARGDMFGFLNVFLVAAFLHAGVDSARLAPLLTERDAAQLQVTPAGVSWRGLTLDAAQLRAARQLAGSFGSCSFEEPVQDLAALSLLPDFTSR